MERDIGCDFQCPDGGINCKNYEVCDGVLPKWWFECKGCYLCINCLISGTGVLETTENLECPICLEIKRGIKLPKCSHQICIECYKRCYHGQGNTEGEPSFPYPEIEDEYDEDQTNSRWLTDYPLIKVFNEELNKWDDDKEEKYANEEYLRTCPLCRTL